MQRWPGRILSTWTTRAAARRCRTCGCCCRATAPSSCASSARWWTATSEFGEFDRRELALIEPLRTLRLVHYSAWLAQRWHDPIFPINFPWFGSSDYWKGQVDMLIEQTEAMQEAPLVA